MDNTNLDSDARPDADIRTSPLLDHPADRAPRRRALLAALAACAVLAAAGAYVLRRAAPSAGLGAASTAPPSWAVGRFYIPSVGFSYLATSDRYGEGRQIFGSSGKWMATVGAVVPAWRFTNPDRSRPADEATWSAQLYVAKWMTTTLTVRNAAGAIVASTEDRDRAGSGVQEWYPLGLKRSTLAGPLAITADDGTEKRTVSMPVHAVTDGTAIRAHTLRSAARRPDLTLRVTDVAAWPGGVALRLEGGTGQPTDRVIVTTARLTGDGPATVILSPRILLRDDRGRTYPLLGAESFEQPEHAYWGPHDFMLQEQLVGGDGPPTASIGLPATLRFAPLAADTREVALEVADALVVVDSTGSIARGLARLVPARGTLFSLTPPLSLDPFPRSTRPPNMADRYWTGGNPIVPVDQAITIGGVRTRVATALLSQEPNGSEGGSGRATFEIARLNLEAPPAGSRRFVIDAEAWTILQPDGSVRCEGSNASHGFRVLPGGDVRIPWPPSISVTGQHDPRYPPQRRARICIVTPVIAVHDTWTMPLPAGPLIADQQTNGTGATD